MSRYLPYSRVRWLTLEEINKSDESLIPKDSYGYILEVDLKYPEELHDLHNDHRLAI